MNFNYIAEENTFILKIKGQAVKLNDEEAKKLKEIVDKELLRNKTFDFGNINGR